VWRVYGGALIVIVGIAAFIEACSHRPVAAVTFGFWDSRYDKPPSGLSQTVYDLLRIGAWALVILGALTVILGLIRYWRAP
jgi:uncharacterized membrane protein HdeD (DUF308 family)